MDERGSVESFPEAYPNVWFAKPSAPCSNGQTESGSCWSVTNAAPANLSTGLVNPDSCSQVEASGLRAPTPRMREKFATQAPGG